MSKRSRPQPISAPAPESFLPTFDFGPAPKQKSSAAPPLPSTRKPVVSLSKRLAAFAFLNLEDIAEEMDDHGAAHRSNTSPIDRISPSSTTSTKSTRFWEFNRSKQQLPITPASLPPMSSKAYATLIGGSATGAKSSSSSTSTSSFTPPPSKVIRQAAAKSPQPAPLQRVQEENPRSLAIDLVSIFSVSASDDAETSPYSKTRFSFPMPPSSIPRRGSQSPLDPEMSMSSYHATSPSIGSMTSPSSDYSFFSPLFSPGFTHPKSPSSDAEPEYNAPISPLEKSKPKSTRKRSIRPLTSLPPCAPPPRESPPPTPTSPTLSARVAAAKRAFPSPELDPELSAAESPGSSILSVLMGGSEGNNSSLSLSTGDESDAESAVSVLGPLQSDPQPRRKQSAVDPVDVWANWGFGAPSRSDSIVTLTQRAYNSGMRGSISTASGPGPVAVSRSGSVGLGSPTGRNGSFGSSEVYGDWDQAIDDLFSFSSISRKPSLASIAYAATAEGAALASTSMNVVENTAFVMDDEMMQKFMESKFLVPTRDAPTPPKQPHATLEGSEASRSTVSLDQTTGSATPSASATSSARSSLDEERSTHSHHAPLTPVLEPEEYRGGGGGVLMPVVAPLSLSKGTRTRPAPIIASQSYPSANPTSRPPRPPRPPRMLSAAQTPKVPAISPLDITHRPPPTQSVPSESSLFSPSSLSGLSMSPQSPQAAFTTAIDIDSWPTWSSIDVAFERKRDWRRPSAGAMTMVSKFSDDTVEVRPKKQRRDGMAKTSKKSAAQGQGQGQNMNPGSSHTSYTFLGLKKRKENSSPKKMAAQLQMQMPRESVDSARSAASVADGSVSRRDGLKRPPLPLELFIRA